MPAATISIRVQSRIHLLAGLLLLVVGVAAGALVFEPVRSHLRGWSAIAYLNAPALRQLDAWLYNLRSDLRLPAAMGDGRAPTGIALFDPMGLAVDPVGSVFVSDRGVGGPGRVVWRITPEEARIIAGTGRRGIARTGIPARRSSLGSPQGLSLDSQGRLYIADSYNHVVLRLESDGCLSRYAGTGRPGAGGDGGLAVRAQLNQPYDVRVDPVGNLFIADHGNHRIRMVTPAGVIKTVAGIGEPGYSGDGAPAVSARLHGPYGVFPDPHRGLLIADSRNHVIRQVGDDGRIRTIAGIGAPGNSGDNGPAERAMFDTPQGLWVDAFGRIFIGDEHNHQIRLIDESGIVRRVGGTGSAGFSSDGAHGVTARLRDPENFASLPDGTLLFTEAGNGRLRTIDRAGRLATFAGGAN